MLSGSSDLRGCVECRLYCWNVKDYEQSGEFSKQKGARNTVRHLAFPYKRARPLLQRVFPVEVEPFGRMAKFGGVQTQTARRPALRSGFGTIDGQHRRTVRGEVHLWACS